MQPLAAYKTPAAMGAQLQPSQMQLAKLGGLVVQACGRSLKMPDHIRGIKEIQDWLQVELGMREQTFELYDQHGEKLLRDDDLARTVSDGMTTITATLSDASIHLIENRREELAQMQWKLVRDQQHHASMKIAQLSRAVAAVEQALEVEVSERTTMDERVKGDVAAALDRVRTEAAVGIRQVEEQCAGVSNMITNERNLREASLQRQSSDMQAIREVINANREAANQGIAHVQAQTDSYRKLVDQERSFREALDAKVGQDMEGMSTRMDEAGKSLQSLMLEYRRSFEQTTQDMNASFDAHGRNFLKLKTDLENSHADSTAKVGMVEDQVRSLETRIADMMERHSETLDRFGQRNEKITLGLESIKADAAADRHTVTTVSASIAEMENMVKEMRKEVSDRSIADRKRREEELRSFKDSILTEHGTRLAKLENKIAARLERESAAREESAREIYDGLKKDTEDSSSKRDITKAGNQLTGSAVSAGLSAISNGTGRSASQHMLGMPNAGSMSIPLHSSFSGTSIPPGTAGIRTPSVSVPNSARSSTPVPTTYMSATKAIPPNVSNCGSMTLPAGRTVYEPVSSTSSTGTLSIGSTPLLAVRPLVPGGPVVAIPNSASFTPRTLAVPTAPPRMS